MKNVNEEQLERDEQRIKDQDDAKEREHYDKLEAKARAAFDLKHSGTGRPAGRGR